MNTSQNLGTRRGLRALAIVLLLVGGVGIYFGTHNYPIRVLSLVAIISSAYLVRISRNRQNNMAKTSGPAAKFTERPGRVLWLTSLVLVGLFGIALLFLRIDAANGYREIWPVYLFAGVGVVCVAAWGLLVAKASGNR